MALLIQHAFISGGSRSGSRPPSQNTDSKHGSIQSLDSYGTVFCLF